MLHDIDPSSAVRPRREAVAENELKICSKRARAVVNEPLLGSTGQHVDGEALMCHDCTTAVGTNHLSVLCSLPGLQENRNN